MAEPPSSPWAATTIADLRMGKTHPHLWASVPNSKRGRWLPSLTLARHATHRVVLGKGERSRGVRVLVPPRSATFPRHPVMHCQFFAATAVAARRKNQRRRQLQQQRQRQRGPPSNPHGNFELQRQGQKWVRNPDKRWQKDSNSHLPPHAAHGHRKEKTENSLARVSS